MAHNALIRGDLAAWSSTTAAVTPAEIYGITLQAFQSINGDLGGVWAPASVIEIGGLGLLVSGPFSTSGTFDCGSAVANFGNISSAGSIDALGGITAHSGQIQALNGATLDGTVTINGATTFNSSVTLNDPIECWDNVS